MHKALFNVIKLYRQRSDKNVKHVKLVFLKLLINCFIITYSCFTHLCIQLYSGINVIFVLSFVVS